MTIATIETPLDELARQANERHAEMTSSLIGALNSAILCGESLLAAWQRIPQDEWQRWCETELNFTYDYAQRFVRLAHYKDQLPLEAWQPKIDTAGKIHQPSTARAFAYLRGLPPLRLGPVAQPVQAEVKDEARRLHGQGLSQAKIAEMLGVSRATISNVLDPEQRRRRAQRSRRRSKELRVARRALAEKREREERLRLARTSPLGGVYSRLRKTLDELDAFSDDRRVASVYASLHAAEDHLIEAMRTLAIESKAVT